MAYIDKIDPSQAEGRLVVSYGRITLKDEHAPRSDVPLDRKSDLLFQYLKEKGFSNREVERFKETYCLIERYAAAGNISAYNRLYTDHTAQLQTIIRWILFDFYDMMPTNRKYSPSAYDKLNTPYRCFMDEWLEDSKGKRSDLTLSVEGSSFASFLLYLQEHNINNLSMLDDLAIECYLRDTKCNVNLVYRLGLILKRYASSVGDEELYMVSKLFPKQRLYSKVYQSLSSEERTRLESFLLDASSPISKRDRAIGILMYYTGMRKEDVAFLTIDNIHWHDGYILFMMHKTNKEQRIVLRPVVGNAIHDYLTGERPETDSPYVFLSKSKTAGEYRTLFFNLPTIINELYDSAGIRQGNCRKGTHLLRHNMGEMLIQSGNDISVVAETLGHSHVSTTLGYLNSDIERLRACSLSIETYPIRNKLYAND